MSPELLQEYVSGTVYNNSLIVVSGDRDTYVSYDDLYEYTYSDDYTSYNTSFSGESTLTSAIDYVTREDLPKLYTLTGHGEADLTSTFQSAGGGAERGGGEPLPAHPGERPRGRRLPAPQRA